MKDPRDIILSPVVSEKSYDLIDKANTYTFVVDRRSNKSEIKDAVQEIFSVTVRSVNTQNRAGKFKRTGRVPGPPQPRQASLGHAGRRRVDRFVRSLRHGN